MGPLKRKIKEAEILDFMKRGGFSKPTLLQKRVIPIIARGGDIAIEAGEKTGKTAAFILPLVKYIDTEKPGIKAVVLTHSADKVRKIRNEFKRLVPHGSGLTYVPLNEDEEIRKEVRLLSRTPDVIIGTPGRVIDHIRRGNIDLSKLENVIIMSPGGNDNKGFEKDIDFIFTKIPLKRQTILFSPNLKAEGRLMSFLKHPAVIPASKWKREKSSIEHSFIEVEEHGKRNLLVDLINAKNLKGIVVFCRTIKDAEDLHKYLKRKGMTTSLVHHEQRQPAILKNERDFKSGKNDILITTDLGAEKIHCRPKHIINFDIPPSSENYLIRAGFNTEREEELSTITTFVTKEQYFELLKIEESIKMNIKKEDAPQEEDILKGTIKKIVQVIKEEEDPDILNYYRKIVRQNVPIFLRSYFAAYLLKIYLGKEKKQEPGITKLFVSVGKNRRVFPRDLRGLFISKLNLKASQVGPVKILDNYSFIDIPSRYAKEAIEKLNGIDFKGRKITVNYARKKEGSKS